MEPLEELVQCKLCSNRLSNPKMLPCQHTFCLNCLEQNAKCKKCPICDGTFQNDSLGDLPNNLYIDSLLTLLSKQTHSVDSSQVHQFNSVNNSMRHCIKCQIVFHCTSVENENSSIKFCNHCKQEFCVICWNSHTMELRQQMGELQIQLTSAQQYLQNKLDILKDRWDQLNIHITNFVEKQINDLKLKEIELMNEAKIILDEAITIHDDILTNIQQTRINLNSKIEFSDENQDSSFIEIHKEICAINDQISKWGEIHANINENELKLVIKNNISQESDVKISMALKENLFSDPEALTTYYNNKIFETKLVWQNCPRPFGVCVAPWDDIIIKKKLLYVAGSDAKTVFAIEMETGQIIHRIQKEEMICPHSIAFSKPQEEIFISDKWNHCVFVFKKDGSYDRCIGTKGDIAGSLRAPEGIAIGSNNTIYICDTGNDRVQCLNIFNGQMHLQFGLIKQEQLIDSITDGTIAELADLSSPTGITLYKDQIIVLDSGHNRIKIFNNYGQKLMEFGQSGKLKGQFMHPEVFSIDPYGFIYVGDSGNARIQIFNHNGQLVKLFGERGTGNGKFNWISGIFVTSNLDIIVTDYKSNSLQIFH